MKKKLLGQFFKLTENYYKKIKNDELFFYSAEAKNKRSKLIGLLSEIDDDINNLLGENRLIEINLNSHLSILSSALSEDYKKAVYCLNILLNNLKKYSETDKNEKTSREEIIKLIESGESKFLELKSSLRWDIENNKEDVGLEFIILKSISAFANTGGGTLIIGVDDNGKILGLKKDYESLKNQKATKDEFELHLRGLIIENFKNIFSISNINLEFVSFGNEEICKIDILKSNKPVYFKDRFHVRIGNSTRELNKLEEIVEFYKKRFD